MRKRSIGFVFVLLLVWGVITYFLFLDRPIGKEQEKQKLSNDIGQLENAVKEQIAINQRLLQELEEKRLHEKFLSESEHAKEAKLPTNANPIEAETVANQDPREDPIRKYVEQAGQKHKGTVQQLEKNESVDTTLEKLSKIASQKTLKDGSPIIAVLVFSCNRVTVERCLKRLIKYRPSAEQFPIVVSQDCEHQETTNVIKSFGNEVFYIHQPDQSDIPVPPKEKKFKGYFKIARHYGWALNQTFIKFGFNTAIVVEDDLDVAPDFFEYFMGTYPLLVNDRSLWCVSAWNDNGKPGLVDEQAANVLYRTDFFPGLGWMLTRSLWEELAPKWPKSFWDDWIRQPEQRKNRACIRPELSRTTTFGKAGVSNGLFFDKHLKYIKLNEQIVPFTKMNLTYLLRENYDVNFIKSVYQSEVVDYSKLKSGQITAPGSVRIPYNTRQTYKSTAKMLGLMDDFRSGVPRTSYRGVVTFFYNGRRVYLAPNANWNGYDITWS